MDELTERSSNKSSVIVIAIIFMLSLAACSSHMDAWSDYDPAADFTGLQSYSWLSENSFLTPTPDEPHATELNDRRIRAAAERVMVDKNFIKRSLDEADIEISFTVGTRQKIETLDRGVEWYRSSYWYGDRVLMNQPEVRTYTEGTLAIDIFDRTTKKQIWHGWASERIRAGADVEKLINEAVEAILSEFPPISNATNSARLRD